VPPTDLRISVLKNPISPTSDNKPKPHLNKPKMLLRFKEECYLTDLILETSEKLYQCHPEFIEG